MLLYYYSVYIAFYFELADDTYSVRVPCTDPYLYFLLCSFVECIDIPWFHGIIITFSLSLVCPKAFFCKFLYKFLFILQEICPKLNAEILSEEMQKRPPTELVTVRHACDGP